MTLIISLWVGLFVPKAFAQIKPYGLTDRPAIGSFLNDTMPEQAPTVSGDWSAIPAFPYLLFTNAIGMVPVPGTGQLALYEREGRVWSFVNDSNATGKTLVLDIHNQCQGWDDSGLLGIAFHPGFATNHFIFVYYTWVAPGTVKGDAKTRPPMHLPGVYHDRLSRFTLDDHGVALPDSETVFYDQTADSCWHNGGGMFFHPGNGFLYFTHGDGADLANTQTITNGLFSGVFRIDVDQRGGSISHPIPRQPNRGHTAHYYIPNDNPFVGQPNALEEYFCLGLRNPHRMTYDPGSGRIFIGDVGESSREEIDVIESGESALNFQWPRIEGMQGDLQPPYIGINRRPVLDYSHTDGAAIIGGYVYRGPEFSRDLGGKYIFGDNVARTIWLLDESQLPARKIPLCVLPKGDGPSSSGGSYVGLSSFGIDQNGEVYMSQMSNIGGRVYKLSRRGAPIASRPLPRLLSQTGAFADLAKLTPADALVPYTVNSPLWSDGADKHRWIALATNTTIDFAANGEWTFPQGTVFVKHFDLPVNETDPTQTRRLETRLLVCDTNGGVYGASYKWRSDYSDADLVESTTNVDYTIATAAGNRTQTWTYPGRQDCLRCHNLASGGVLGVKTRQLNGDFTYPNGITDNQLRAWSHAGMFKGSLDEAAIPQYAKLVKVTDTNAPPEFRARSFLDANCAQCHRPGGVPSLFDARFDTPLVRQNLTNGFVVNPLNIVGARTILPAKPDHSILYVRITSPGDIKMPPLARNVVDQDAVTVLADWINSLTPNTNSLPAPWNHADVGGVGLAGDTSFDADRFNVVSSGSDIWDVADQFHYVYQNMNGDGEIRARIVSVYNSQGWAKAGVMFRNSLDTGAKNVYMAVSAGNGTILSWRTNTDGVTADIPGTNQSAAYWVRLARKGNVFSGYTSPDGMQWTLVGTATVLLNSQTYVGLAVTAHDNQTLNSSVFDHVSTGPVIASHAPPTTPNTSVLTQPVVHLVDSAE